MKPCALSTPKKDKNGWLFIDPMQCRCHCFQILSLNCPYLTINTQDCWCNHMLTSQDFEFGVQSWANMEAMLPLGARVEFVLCSRQWEPAHFPKSCFCNTRTWLWLCILSYIYIYVAITKMDHNVYIYAHIYICTYIPFYLYVCKQI
jgi:hypothetical protein